MRGSTADRELSTSVSGSFWTTRWPPCTAPATPKAAATQERVSGETTEGGVQREAESELHGLHLVRLRTLTFTPTNF